MAAWQITVRGRVQGVGYRAACVAQAQWLGLRGWVGNCRDGSVRALVVGDETQLQAMRSWMQVGPRGACVNACEIAVLDENSAHEAGSASFHIRVID
ncbi:acylphosphatase [Pandoraea sp.]|uniref:acylphosphatase n=1 Tax=Pandoraea sp. TaxID=1883445 RepID=UPI001211AF58|nr:acylphosphatase [Pandoraea sp.]TAL53603.1 MAG: acylphosphatase [Pandoraea sp.]TAM14854.1 MAG: acylphosphatase [Pandoraea sp.]